MFRGQALTSQFPLIKLHQDSEQLCLGLLRLLPYQHGLEQFNVQS